MPSFDVTSEVNWAEVDNAVNQVLRELPQRFDFKGVKIGIEVDKKAKTILLTCSAEGKLDALKDTFETKLVKRGVSLLSLDYKDAQGGSAGSARQLINVRDGISKDDGKKIVSAIKDAKFKVQAQIQDEQVRVTGKKRDDLQEVIAFLRTKENELNVPLQFGNFRD